MIRILFLVPYPTEGASNRIRVEQYIPYLEREGISCRIRPFMNRSFYRMLYLPHRYIEKAFWFAICTVNRILDILRASRYDIIFIHREAYPLGGPVIEALLHMMGKPIIFDFDDSIFLPNTSEHNIYIERFKRPDKVAKIIAMSVLVISGNDYLKAYAMNFNKNVVTIPSPVDTDKYSPEPDRQEKKEIVIGWVGSNTTKDFLYDLEGVFIDLSRRYPDILIKIVGASFYSAKLKNVVNKAWVINEEPDDIRSFDIGIMPMPDNEWTRGKCGFKSILYMASGIPVVCSPVGVNKEIVEDGVSGYLAKGHDEWMYRLSNLIEDGELRKRMGAAGRKKAELYYSLQANAHRLLEVVREVSNE